MLGVSKTGVSVHAYRYSNGQEQHLGECPPGMMFELHNWLLVKGHYQGTDPTWYTWHHGHRFVDVHSKDPYRTCGIEGFRFEEAKKPRTTDELHPLE